MPPHSPPTSLAISGPVFRILGRGRWEGEVPSASIPQANILATIASNPRKTSRQLLLWLASVIYGCLSSFGIVYSTLLAHSADLGTSTEGIPSSTGVSHASASGPQLPIEDDSRPVAASYSRYSSDNQTESSNEDQGRVARVRAAMEGYRLPADLEYTDSEVSGTLLQRDGLDQMLKDAKAKKFDLIIFFNLGRLARESIIGMPILKKLVHEWGIRFISLTQSLDSNNANWEMLATIYFMEHENFIKELSANVHRGQVGTLLNDYSVGDYCFGYMSIPSPNGEMRGRGRNAKPKMIYQIHPEHAEWVKQIFSWYVEERRTMSWITRELNRRRAPKDHRSSTPDWSPSQVAGVLTNRKYIGVWPWGKNRNKRMPSTGKVIQVPQPESETKKWVRQRPDLRLVCDEMFHAAQEIRSKYVEQAAKRRGADGRLSGRVAERNTQHLLAGLFKCQECGRTFHTSGAKAQYMSCSGYKFKICTLRTMVPRQLAERLILKAIGDQIERDEDWVSVIVKLTQAEIEAASREQPSRHAALAKELQGLDLKLERLIDLAESSDDPGIVSRLVQRRKERETLLRDLRELEQRHRQPLQVPTEDWVRTQISHLYEHLTSGTPAATLALQNLLDGPIVLEQVRAEGQRPYLRGTLRLRSGQLSVNRATEVPEISADAGSEPHQIQEITIDFREPTKSDEQIEVAWEMLNDSVPIKEIAVALGVSRSRVTHILKLAYAAKGVAPIDGRQRRSTLPESTRPPTLADSRMGEVMELYHQDVLLSDIAIRLALDRNTVTAIISKWHRQQGLTAEDGRTRRKRLEVKSSIKTNPTEPPQPFDAADAA